MERLVLVLTLALLSSPAFGQVLLVDLSEPDPAGLGGLPGITDEEERALREVSGPGPESLGRRLASSGLGTDRLVEVAPYLCVGSTTASWDIDAAAEGKAGAVGTVRQRIRISSNRCRLEAVWKRTTRSPLGQEHGWLSYRGPRNTELAAGAIRARWTGPAPWEDPIVRGRAVRGDDTDCVPSGALETRGVSLRARDLHLMGWRGLDSGSGFMGRVGGSRTCVWGASEAGRGWGGGMGFHLGAARATCAAHLPSAGGRFLRVGIHGREESMGLSLAAPLGEDRGRGTVRMDGWSSVRTGRFRARADGGCTRGVGSGPSRRSGTLAVTHAGSFAHVACSASWADRGGQLVCRIERRLERCAVKVTTRYSLRRNRGPSEVQLGIYRNADRIQGESTVTATDRGWEAGLRASLSGASVRARAGVRVFQRGRTRSFQWDIAVGERGG